MIRIGIVGTGRTVSIANSHLSGYLSDPRCRVVAAYNRSVGTAGEWISAHGLDAVACDSFEQLVRSVDVVDICTPNDSHYEYSRLALEHGRHLLVEKPMALRLDEAQRLAALAERADCFSAVGFVYRFAEPIIELKRLVQDYIGRVYTSSLSIGGKRLADPRVGMEWRMRRAQSGSGALGDFACHLIDICDFALSQRFGAVSCVTRTFIEERQGARGNEKVETDDAAVLSLESSGGIASMTVSRVGMDDLSVLVAGEGGMARLSMSSPATLLFWEKRRDGGYSGSAKEIGIKPHTSFNGWFEAQARSFIDGVCGIESSAASLKDGLYTEAVLDAAARSSASRKTEIVKRGVFVNE